MTQSAQPKSAAVEEALRTALAQGALPGEREGFDDRAIAGAAAFLSATAATRMPGTPAIAIDTTGGESGPDNSDTVPAPRTMRIAIANDDMPFLVDSIANSLAQANLVIHRLLHPVLSVSRDTDGTLKAILPPDAPGARRESMIYIEADRADAKVRRALEQEF